MTVGEFINFVKAGNIPNNAKIQFYDEDKDTEIDIVDWDYIGGQFNCITLFDVNVEDPI